jgi:hypothetical protein
VNKNNIHFALFIGLVVVLSFICIHIVNGLSPVVSEDEKGRQLQTNVNFSELENLGGKHIKPKKISCNTIIPNNTTSSTLGSATDWWGVIHYHTLTAHSLKERANKKISAVSSIKKIRIENKKTYPVDVYVDEGTDINQLLVYLIDSIKELDAKIVKLEKQAKEK